VITGAPSITPMPCDYDTVNESSSSLGVSVTTVESDVMKLTKLQSVSKCHVEASSTYDESVTLSVAFTEHNLMGTHNTSREQTAYNTVNKHDVELPPSNLLHFLLTQSCQVLVICTIMKYQTFQDYLM